METRELDDKFKKWRNINYYYPYSELTNKPNWRIAILTCMDCRITSQIFGIEDPGEAIIIRNAGSLLTFDTFRSLLLAIYELKVETIVVVGHTDCGACMSTSQMNGVIAKISKRINKSPDEILRLLDTKDAKEAFLGFSNMEVQIYETVNNIRRHPLISGAEVEVVGYIYDTTNGELNKVQ
jgi:carbonic anhydrase